MSKFWVLVIAIVVIGGLEAIALLKGINGKAMALSFTAIGVLVGYAFGVKPAAGAAVDLAKEIFVKKVKPLGLALALSLGLAGCAELKEAIQQVLPRVEACVNHPEYGEICVSWDGKQVSIKAAAKLPPELEAELGEWIQRLK